MSQMVIKNVGTAGAIPISESADGKITEADVIAITVENTSSQYYVGSATVKPNADASLFNGTVYVSYYRDPLIVPQYSEQGLFTGVQLCVCANHNTTTNQLIYRIGGYSTSEFVSRWNGEGGQSLGTDGLLYIGSYDAYANNIEEIRDWDEAPSTNPVGDPDNLLPQGGEFADIEPFSTTDLQFLSQLEEPETINYGKMITAYQLYPDELQAIGDAIFLPNFWTALKNKFEGLSDPMSFIISAVELPFCLGVTPTTFSLGGVEVENSAGNPIACTKHTGRYLKYSFGSISLKEVWGSAKDYTDCSIDIFLPYVGMRSIDPELGVNSRLTLAMIVDVWTGDLNYLMQVDNENSANKYFTASCVPYRWSGNCGNRIPIGKVDPSTPILSVVSSLGSIALGAGMMALTGGIGGAAAAATGGMVTAGSAAGAGAGGSLIMGGAKDAASQLSKGFAPTVQSSGNISGATGYLDYQYPYLIIKRGVPAYPNNWRTEIGAPRYQEFTLSDLSGYTEFAEIHADEVNGASDEEKLMIEDILKSGVIL